MRYSILIIILVNIQLYPAASKPKYTLLAQEEPAVPVIITAPQIAIPEVLQAYMKNKDNTGLATWLEEQQQHRLQFTHEQLAPVAAHLAAQKKVLASTTVETNTLHKEKIAFLTKMRALLRSKPNVEGTYEDNSVFEAKLAELKDSTFAQWITFIDDLPDVTHAQESTLLSLFDRWEQESHAQLDQMKKRMPEQKMQLTRIKTVLEHYARARMKERECFPHGNSKWTQSSPVCYSCECAQDPCCGCCDRPECYCDGNGWFNVFCQPVRYLLCIPAAWTHSCCTYCFCPLRYPEN